MMFKLNKRIGLGILGCILVGGLVGIAGEKEEDFGDEKEVVVAYEPKIAGASNEGENAIAGMRIGRGMKLKLLAAEPLVANPVGFWIDDLGRYWVAETFRQGNKGIPDNRSHKYWLEDDLASQSVEDRVAYYLKYHPEYAKQFTEHHDRIRLVEDTTGNGLLDKSTVFDDSFNAIADGTGAAVLVNGKDVYYTCIPKLWKLKDVDGDGKVDEREVLHDGFGVNTALRGHDMHGLKIGPDGMLYFSIGDRGYNLVTKEGKVLKDAETGAIFRCNLDGTGLEVFAYGLRNPQDLVFDEYGQLFTGDNNSDSIDRARWVYVLEGGHTGWRMAYQTLKDRGAWNRENLWHEMKTDQPAWVVPPIKHLGSGPSGVAYEPGGSALPKRYRDHFFMCDFRGGAGNSILHTFELEPRGAGFKLIGSEALVRGSLVTDVDFAPDGSLAFLDWVHGWMGVNKGRIYTAVDPGRVNDPVVLEIKKLLKGGFKGYGLKALGGFLGHVDLRIRRHGQFELVKRGASCVKIFEGVLADASSNRMAKIHAMWGLEQYGRENKVKGACAKAVAYLGSRDEKLRMIAADVVGRGKVFAGYAGLIKLLSDDSLRVRYSAAVALGKLGDKRAVGAILKMLGENNDRDPYLRHGGVMGLKLIGDIEGMMRYRKDSSSAKRMGILLAMRWLKDKHLGLFLHDRNPLLVVEAGRGIYDDRLMDLMPELAGLMVRVNSRRIQSWEKAMGRMHTRALVRRILAASLMSGKAKDLNEVARVALSDGLDDHTRGLFLDALSQWMSPSNRDIVHGQWRPLGKRVLKASLVRLVVGKLLRSKDGRAEDAGVKLVGRLKLKGYENQLFQVLKNAKKGWQMRGHSLDSLKAVGYKRLGGAVKLALKGRDAKLRVHASRYLADLPGEEAYAYAVKGLKSKSLKERQASLLLLGKIDYRQADRLLGELMQHLKNGKLEKSLELELLEAVGMRRKAVAYLDVSLARYEKQLRGGGIGMVYRDALYGGDAGRGREIFRYRASTQCIRCHQVRGIGGGDAGPALTGIGNRAERGYLIESIVDPNARFADGFEVVRIEDKEGEFYAGKIVKETKKTLTLIYEEMGEKKQVTIEKAKIATRVKGLSAMPMDLMKYLDHRDLRDIVAFLSSQTKGGKKVKKAKLKASH